MGIEKFQIYLDVNPPVFYAGQNISGRLVVSNSTPKTFRSLYFEAKGEASVCWMSSKKVTKSKLDPKSTSYYGKSGRNDDKDTYKDKEVYFVLNLPVFEGVSEQTLEPGERTFPFSFTLPTENLPSSFEGCFGHIRYSIKAVMKRPWKFDHEAKVLFTIISPLDLNQFPQSGDAVRVDKIKKFTSLKCSSGPVNIVLSLHAGGAAVVPGDTIFSTLEIENNSAVKLHNTSLRFIKSVTFKAKDGQCIMHVVAPVLENNLGKVERGQFCTFENQAMKIPSLPPSKLVNCKIINVDYFLEAKLCPFGAHRDFKYRIPVLVGTVPLVQNFAMYVQATQSLPSSHEFTPSVPQIDDAPPSYADLAPPSYMESFFGTTNVFDENDDKHVFGDKNFAPMYPVFNSS